MARFKPVQISAGMDVKTLVKRLYQFNEDLKFTMSNLDIEDNCSRSMIDEIDQRNDMLRTIQFDSDGLQIRFEDLKEGTVTQLTQAEDAIGLLVSRGSVVETMLTRMELYGDSIYMKTGHITVDAKNFTLNREGDAWFSGDIIGGSINIGNGKFVVNANGDCYIDDSLETETLNPSAGIYAAELEVYNDDEYLNQIADEVTVGECYIVELLNCADVNQRSDQRIKMGITGLDTQEAVEICQKLRPKAFAFKETGTQAFGLIAQEVEVLSSFLPLVRDGAGGKEIPYTNYIALLTSVIQDNQRRIDRLKERRGHGLF